MSLDVFVYSSLTREALLKAIREEGVEIGEGRFRFLAPSRFDRDNLRDAGIDMAVRATAIVSIDKARPAQEYAAILRVTRAASRHGATHALLNNEVLLEDL